MRTRQRALLASGGALLAGAGRSLVGGGAKGPEVEPEVSTPPSRKGRGRDGETQKMEEESEGTVGKRGAQGTVKRG